MFWRTTLIFHNSIEVSFQGDSIYNFYLYEQSLRIYDQVRLLDYMDEDLFYMYFFISYSTGTAA